MRDTVVLLIIPVWIPKIVLVFQFNAHSVQQLNTFLSIKVGKQLALTFLRSCFILGDGQNRTRFVDEGHVLCFSEMTELQAVCELVCSGVED